MEKNLIMLLIYITIIIFIVLHGIFTVLQVRIRLGKLKYRLIPKSKIFDIAYLTFFTFLFIFIMVRWPKLADVRQLSHELRVVSIGGWAILCIRSILDTFKDGEIREKGIYAKKNILEWKDIKSFKLKEKESIVLETNRKSFFRNTNKTVKLMVDKEIEEVVNLIDDNVKRYNDDLT
ncbi:MAG: hypothetical protein JJT76_10890 [Clostridiaceae bacterium]|nr:hypothetical protein [Clostridiaceae bacterium]